MKMEDRDGDELEMELHWVQMQQFTEFPEESLSAASTTYIPKGNLLVVVFTRFLNT